MAKPFVLIIEDERDIAALFRHVVDMLGYRTEIALTGEIAMERLAHSQPDIVVLDLNLPGVSGTEILKNIREDKRLDQTKIIVATAHAYIADSLPVEPDLILLKPVSIAQLSVFIRRLGLPEIDEELNPWDKNTGLYNQAFFMKRLESSLRQAKESDQYLFAVLSFKLSKIYDIRRSSDTKTWEGALGDIVEGTKRTLRPTDTIASIDQDNFYILIENIPSQNIPMMVATRIEEMLDESLSAIGEKAQKPAGVGITICDRRCESVEEILAEVERAQALANTPGDQ